MNFAQNTNRGGKYLNIFKLSPNLATSQESISPFLGNLSGALRPLPEMHRITFYFGASNRFLKRLKASEGGVDDNKNQDISGDNAKKM